MVSQSILIFLHKNKKILLASLLASCIALALYMYAAYVPMYQSVAKLYIKNISSGNVVATYGNEESLASESGYSNPLFNYQEVMRSELVAKHCYESIRYKYAKQLKKLGLHNERQWIATFGKLIDTKVIPSTDIIQLTFRWSDKESAGDVTRLILQSLRLTNLDILRGVTLQQREFLDTQLANISHELLDVRTQIKNFKLVNGAIALNDETTELIRRRVELQQQASSLKSNISYNERKAKELVSILGVKNAQDAMLSNNIGNDPYLQNQEQQLTELQKEYQGLNAKFTDAYPPVQALKNKIETVTKAIAGRRKEILGSYIVNKGLYNKASSDIVTDLARVQADAASLTAQYNALQQGVDLMKEQESSIPGKKLALDELEKKELALANAYDSVKKKQMEARIQENAIVDNIIILSDPTPGKLDVKQLFMTCFGILALGLMLGVAFAWLKEGISDEWTNTEEVEQKTGKPVLGVLPWHAKKALPVDIQTSYETMPDLIRTFDNMAQNLINRSYLENTKTIAFCSLATERQGSPVVSQLALSLASAGHRVLLVDADMQIPLRHLNYFDCKKVLASNGLDAIIPEVNRQLRLSDAEEVSPQLFSEILHTAVTHIKMPNATDGFTQLDYISTMTPQSRGYDFIASPGFKLLINQLKSKYDFVLIDTPALPIHFPEIDTIISLAEGIVLLSPYNTKRTTLIRHIKRLNAKGKNGLGILMRSKQPA